VGSRQTSLEASRRQVRGLQRRDHQCTCSCLFSCYQGKWHLTHLFGHAQRPAAPSQPPGNGYASVPVERTLLRSQVVDKQVPCSALSIIAESLTSPSSLHAALPTTVKAPCRSSLHLRL
jgi:hypothetical protein